MLFLEGESCSMSYLNPTMPYPRSESLLWEHAQMSSNCKGSTTIGFAVRGPSPVRDGRHLALPLAS